MFRIPTALLAVGLSAAAWADPPATPATEPADGTCDPEDERCTDARPEEADPDREVGNDPDADPLRLVDEETPVRDETTPRETIRDDTLPRLDQNGVQLKSTDVAIPVAVPMPVSSEATVAGPSVSIPFDGPEVTRRDDKVVETIRTEGGFVEVTHDARAWDAEEGDR